MKRIKHLNTILIVLIMINYSFFSVINSNGPTKLNEGIDFGKVSTNEFPNYEITDFDTFGLGYAVVSRNRYNFRGYNLSYYDFNHHLIWSKILDRSSARNTKLDGFNQNLIFFNSFYTDINYPNDGIFLSNATPNATIYDLEGTIVSTFPIYITPMSNETGLDYQWKRSRIVDSLISENEVYFIELVEGQLLNSTYELITILYSYNLLTGQLKWEVNLTKDTYPSSDTLSWGPLLGIYEYKFTASSEMLLMMGNIYNDISLKQISIKLDNLGNLEGITNVENKFDCVDYCRDDIVLSFDEVIGVSERMDGDEVTITLKSSFGPELEILTSYWSNQVNSYTGINFYHVTSLSSKEIMINGVIFLEPQKFTSFMGYLISDNKLSVTLFDMMNTTFIGSMIKIDETRILISQKDLSPTMYSIAIWSLNKLKAIDFVNPYYINIIPGLTIILLIVNLSYTRYKKWNKR